MRTTYLAPMAELLGQLAFSWPLKFKLPWQRLSGAKWAPALGGDQAVSEISQS